MSLYNMTNGYHAFNCVFILPMLGKNPREYPRFRDCFLSNEDHPEFDNCIHIYTRVGSLNRGDVHGEEELEKEEGFLGFYDDPKDKTYGTYVFKVPDTWKEDFKILLAKIPITNISKEYKDEIYRVYPLLESMLDNIFREVDND